MTRAGASGRSGDRAVRGRIEYPCRDAIRLYWENVRTERSSTSTLREIEVELPA